MDRLRPDSFGIDMVRPRGWFTLPWDPPSRPRFGVATSLR